MLGYRVLLKAAVLPHHAKGGTSTAGHAGKALAPREAEHCHLVKAYGARSACKLRPLQDGVSWLCLENKQQNHHVN